MSVETVVRRGRGWLAVAVLAAAAWIAAPSVGTVSSADEPDSLAERHAAAPGRDRYRPLPSEIAIPRPPPRRATWGPPRDDRLRGRPQADADGDATITVCPSGCDHTSVQAAVDAATVGDTISIGSGTYRETVHIATSLTVRGVDPSVTILDGNGQGPVVTVEGGVGVTMSGLTVTGGRAASGAGILNQGALTLVNCAITGNQTTSESEGYGGGIFNYGGLLAVDRSTVADNQATLGGGVLNGFGWMTLSRSRVMRNTATRLGGAIYNGVESSVRIDTASLADNKVVPTTADGRGGGIFSAGFAYVSRSTLSGNRVAEVGGAIFQYQDTTILTNSTVAGNVADVGGAGIYVSGGSVLVTNGTFSGNSGTFGAIWSNDKATLRNTLLGDNLPTSCFGEITSQGHNLDSGNSCSFRTEGDLVNVNPRMGPLADNGGATWTQSIRAGSPAIDAGDPLGCTAPDDTLLTTDQRGFDRPVDGNGDGVKRCDIGAYEFQPEGLATPTPTPTPPNPGAGAVTVCASGCQHRSVQAAVDAVGAGGTVFVRAGTYVENVTVSRAVTLTGAGAHVTEIDGNRAGPALTVAAGAKVAVSGLALVRGQGVQNAGELTLTEVSVAFNAGLRGGGIFNTGTLTVVGGTVSSNVALEDHGGGIHNAGGTVVLRQTTVAGNTANGRSGDGYGGGVFSSGSLTVEDSLVTSNESRFGGGVANNGGRLALARSNLVGNRAEFGGALYTAGGQAAIEGGNLLANLATIGGGVYQRGPLRLTNARIAQNVASGANAFGGGILNNGSELVVRGGAIAENESTSGGAIYAYKPEARVDLAQTTLSGNKASFGGGLLQQQGTAVLDGVSVTGNASFADGGGAFLVEGVLTVRGGAFVANTCVRNGAGLFVGAGGTAEVNGTEITGSVTEGNGAGVYVQGQLTLVDSDVLDNQTSEATSTGGGVFNDGGRVTIRASTLAGNTAAEGGGVANTGTLRMENSTLSGNRGTRGAGLHNATGSALLANVTFYSNTLEVRIVEPTETPEPTEPPETPEPAPGSRADRDRMGGDQGQSGAGGAIYNATGGTVTLRHTLIGPSTDVDNCFGRLTSDGYNLDSGRSCGMTASGDRAGVDPRLDLLADNGGATLTHALAPDSPAVDAGSPAGCRSIDNQDLRQDQRRRPRPEDGNDDGVARCDIGAFELGAGGPDTPTPTGTRSTPVPTVTGTPPTPTATRTTGPAIYLPMAKKHEP